MLMYFKNIDQTIGSRVLNSKLSPGSKSGFDPKLLLKCKYEILLY